MKNFGNTCRSTVHVFLKENGSERLHGTMDIIPSRLQLFTAAELSSPSHHVPLFTPRTTVRTTYRCSHHVPLFVPLFTPRTTVRTTYRCSHHVPLEKHHFVLFAPRTAVRTTYHCSHHVPLFRSRPRTTVHTTPVLNIRMRKCFDGEKIS